MISMFHCTMNPWFHVSQDVRLLILFIWFIFPALMAQEFAILSSSNSIHLQILSVSLFLIPDSAHQTIIVQDISVGDCNVLKFVVAIKNTNCTMSQRSGRECIMYNVQCTMVNVQCTMYIAHCTAGQVVLCTTCPVHSPTILLLLVLI